MSLILFDDKDLKLLQSEESKTYFSEILQMYYCKNYRGCIVQLYSFLIFDLYKKLEVMASENNSKAREQIGLIKRRIVDDEKYSIIECEIIEFYKVNFPMYFDNFLIDVEYLKDLRNRCAHLKVNGESLFTPKDYQVRSMICSMFDNIFSVKAPFITKLFNFVENDIENLSSNNLGFSLESICSNSHRIKEQYLSRMTHDALLNNIVDFLKLTFVKINDDTNRNLYGLSCFCFAFLDYVVKEGYGDIFSDAKVYDAIGKIESGCLDKDRKNLLLFMMAEHQYFSDCVFQSNHILFDDITSCCMKNSFYMEKYFLAIFGRKDFSPFERFKENINEFLILSHESLFAFLQKDRKFEINDFFVLIFKKVPTFNGFADADDVMTLLINNLKDISQETIEVLEDIYSHNGQFKFRSLNKIDIKKLNLENNKLDNKLDFKTIFKIEDSNSLKQSTDGQN